VKHGYARVATYPPNVKYQALFLKLEREARENNRGLWGEEPAPEELLPNEDSDIVYITKTGTKYHRLGCRYLKKSAIPITRQKAIAKGYELCKFCKP
jgi:micrococcal nuclease